MTRRLVLPAALLAAILCSASAPADVQNLLFSQEDAQLHGLKRAWYAQVQMDAARARIQEMVLHEGTLFVLTNRAMLQAIDAKTGQTLWAIQVGSPNHPSLTPGVNRDLVAVVNGSDLYVFNRFNGKLLWKTQLDGVPGAGAALSDLRAYVPTVQGMIYSFALEPAKDPLEELGGARRKPAPKVEETAEQRANRMEAFRLSQESIPPLVCQSLGRAMVQPVVTRQDAAGEYVAWPTDQGFLFVAALDRREGRFTIKFRVGTDTGIVAQPGYLPPDPKSGDAGVIFAATKDGYVHAISEKTHEAIWRFSSGEPLVEPAVVVGDTLFVATQPGGMYCVDAKAGAQKWFAPSIVQFVAASKQRVYAADKLGRIQVLSAANGARLDTIPAVGQSLRLRNDESDRIYLASATGLIQCLHEVELEDPIFHAAARRAQGKSAVQQEGMAGDEKTEPNAKPVPHTPTAKAPAVPAAPKKTRPATPKKTPKEGTAPKRGKKKGGEAEEGGFGAE